MRKTKWRIMKRKRHWYAYKRKIGEAVMPYVVPRSQNIFETWREAVNWALADSRRPHA